MKKKNQTAQILIMLLGILIFMGLKLIPNVSGILLSLKDYKIFEGLSNSPWIGFENFKLLFTDYHFIKTIGNTIITNVITMLFTIILSGLMVYGILNAKNKRQALLFTAIYAFPAIIPSVVKASFFTVSLGISINSVYYIVFPLAQASTWAGYASIAAFFLINNDNKRRNIFFIISIAILTIFSRFLSSNTELAYIMANPFILDKANVIDIHSFKSSFIMMKTGIGSAIWVFKLIIELIATTISALLLIVIFKHNNLSITQKDSENRKSSNIINYILCSMIIVGCFHSLIPQNATETTLEMLNIPSNIVLLIGCLLVSFVSSALAGLFAYPYTSQNKNIKIIYSVFLILSLSGVFYLKRFFAYKSLGIINTPFPILLNGFMPIWMIAAYAIYVLRKKEEEILNSKSYVKSILPVSIILGALNFSTMWGSYLPSLTYVYQNNLFTPALLTYNYLMQGTQNLTLSLMTWIPILIVWLCSVYLVYLLLDIKKTK